MLCGLVAGLAVAVRTASVVFAALAVLGTAAALIGVIELCRAWRHAAARNVDATATARELAQQGRAATQSALGAVHGFSTRLIPPQASAKEGIDLYMATLLISLFLFAFSFLFFAALAQRGGAMVDVASQLADSESTISASTVKALFVIVCIMLADRVIYRLWEPPTAIDARGGGDPTVAAASASSASSDAPPVPDRDSVALPPSATAGGSTGHDHGAGGAGRPADECASESADGMDAGVVVPHGHPNLAPALKLTLHVLLTCLLHAEYAFSLPLWSCDASRCSNTSATDCCTSSGLLKAFYLLGCAYLTLSAAQLRFGYPLVVREHPLSDSGDKLNSWLFKAYMATPFLWELRTAIDWTVEVTSTSRSTAICLPRAHPHSVLAHVSLPRLCELFSHWLCALPAVAYAALRVRWCHCRSPPSISLPLSSSRTSTRASARCATT